MIHKAFRNIATLGLLCATLSACATSGPAYKDAKPSFTPIAKNTARVYVYRNVNFFGDAIQPSVLLDNEKIGDARPGGFIMKDVPAGKHALSVAVETKKTYEFTAKPQEEIYIRLVPGVGWLAARIHIEAVPAQEAAAEIATLRQQTRFEPYDSGTTPPADKNGH